MESAVPQAVRDAYHLSGTATPIVVGLVNQTFSATTHAGKPVIVQRLHHAFAASVHWDIDAVSSHVSRVAAARRQAAILPCLVRTTAGALWVEVTRDAAGDMNGRRVPEIWRALETMPGRTLTQVSAPELAFEAGRIAGVFHALTADLQHQFHHVRPGVHDLAAHLDRMQDACAHSRGASQDQAITLAQELSQEIAESSKGLPMIRWQDFPERIIHGDLKISNLRFAEQEERAVGLLDLDTFQRGYLLHEMGDALRSWCNRDGEDGARTRVDAVLFAAAMRGYLAGNPQVSELEFVHFVAGMETIAVELASRFCLDVFQDSYFGWDPNRYPSRRAHNLERARGQLCLALDVRAHRAELERVTQEIWRSETC